MDPLRLPVWADLARRDPVLKATQEALKAAGSQGWVVGGAMRDILLGVPVLDYDLAVSGDALDIGRDISRRFKAAFVPLDPERRIARIVPRQKDRPQLDVASLVGASIEEDLRRRDLTINAMAVDLLSVLQGDAPSLLDPTGGLQDARECRIRVPAAAVLDDDPLRILRVFRFAARLGYVVESDTLAMAGARAGQLRQVSPERIRYELFKILGVETPLPVLSSMLSSGVLPVVFEPMGGASTLERLVEPAWGPRVGDYLGHDYGEGRTRRTLLRFLRLADQPSADGAQALRLSGREVRAVERLLRAVDVPPQEPWPLFEAVQEDSVLWAVYAGWAPSAVEALSSAYERWGAAGRQPLLRGTDILALTGQPPGPRIGELATLLRREQAAGRLTTAEAAQTFLLART